MNVGLCAVAPGKLRVPSGNTHYTVFALVNNISSFSSCTNGTFTGLEFSILWLKSENKAKLRWCFSPQNVHFQCGFKAFTYKQISPRPAWFNDNICVIWPCVVCFLITRVISLSTVKRKIHHHHPVRKRREISNRMKSCMVKWCVWIRS